MTSFKKYFIYHFKSTFFRLVVVTVLSALLVLTFVSTKYYSDSTHSYKFSVDLNVLRFIVLTISIVIAILEFLPFKNRRNLDTTLFLPVDRYKMAAIHFINGFLHILLTIIICFAITFFLLIGNHHPLNIGNFILLFAFSAFGSLAAYSVTAFVFERANTTADGIIWLIFYSFIWVFVYNVGEALYIGLSGITLRDFNSTPHAISAGIFSPYFLIFSVWSTVQRILIPNYIITTADQEVVKKAVHNTDVSLQSSDITGMIVWSILIPLCIFVLIWMFAKKRPENTGSISDSAFGYKILLPVSAISISTSLGATIENVGFYVIMLISLIIGYIIYRRSIKLKVIDYVSIAISLMMPIFLLNLL